MSTKKTNPDIKVLSREQKLALYDLIQEKKLRQRKRKKAFSPHEGQMRVIKSTAWEKYVFCGNGFGKTALLTNEVAWAAEGYSSITKQYTPVPAKIALVLDSAEKIDDFLSEYRKWNILEPEWTQKRGRPNTTFIQYPNGSTVTVLTHGVEPLKLEGSEWTHIFFDEPPPRHVFTAMARGGRQKGKTCRIRLFGTPITEAWLRTDVYEAWTNGEFPEGEVECFRGETSENAENLADGYIERFSRKLSPQERKTRLSGDFFDLEGQALRHLWDRRVHIIEDDEFEWDSNWPVVIAIDPHTSKKHVAIMLGVDRDNYLYILKELALKISPREYAKELKKWMKDYRVLDIVCDHAGNAEMTGGEGYRSFIWVMNDEGIRCRGTRHEEKDDEEFISRIQDALLIPDVPNSVGQKIPKLRALRSCQGFIQNVEQVQWMRDKKLQENKPKLDIRNKDHLAAAKYALATNLHNKKSKARSYHATRGIYGYEAPYKRRKAHKSMLKSLKGDK